MIRINLLADRQAKDRLVIQQQAVTGIIILLATVLVCGLWWQVKAGQISSANERIAQAKVELARQKQIRAAVEKMQKRRDRVKGILEAIDSLMEEKKGSVIYFDNLNVILPKEIWLTDLADRSGAISIQGYSFSNNAIAQFMKNMEKSSHFLNVDLKLINKAKFGKDILKKFTVTCMTTLGKKLADEKKKREEARKAASAKKKRRR